MKKKLLCLLLMASLAGWSVHASSKTLRMLSGWDKSYPGVEMTEFYAAKLKEASDGALTIRRSGPEAVPPFEQLEPVSAGIFDLLYTHPAYHMGATAFGLGLQATKGDPLKWRDNGVLKCENKVCRFLLYGQSLRKTEAKSVDLWVRLESRG
ncbi:MAG TPA: hypothetical protein VIR76_11720 [Pusillimonas sp.]